jgi:hypothetical protein
MEDIRATGFAEDFYTVSHIGSQKTEKGAENETYSESFKRFRNFCTLKIKWFNNHSEPLKGVVLNHLQSKGAVLNHLVVQNVIHFSQKVQNDY